MKSKDTVPMSYGKIVTKYASGTGFLLRSSGIDNQVSFVFYFGGSGANGNFSVGSAPFDAEWNHIVLEINRTIDKTLLYVNTIKDSIQFNLSTLPFDASNTVDLIWGNNVIGTEPYEGLIDECRVYLGIPTEDEIGFLYKYPSGIKPLGKITPRLVSSKLAGSPDSLAAKLIPPSIVSVVQEVGEPTISNIKGPF